MAASQSLCPLEETIYLYQEVLMLDAVGAAQVMRNESMDALLRQMVSAYINDARPLVSTDFYPTLDKVYQPYDRSCRLKNLDTTALRRIDRGWITLVVMHNLMRNDGLRRKSLPSNDRDKEFLFSPRSLRNWRTYVTIWGSKIPPLRV